MSKTFTEQLRVPPASNTWNADGEGMHSLFPLDLIRGLNNLATYCNPHLHYVQNSNGSAAPGGFQTAYSGAGHECFLVEFPLLIPLWASRAVWTAGAGCSSGSSSSLSAVGLYIAADPYTGVAGLSGGGDASNNGAFDTTNLTPGYGHRSVSLTVSAGNYGLADDSSTGITITNTLARFIDDGAGSVNTKRLGYAILTATGGTSCSVEIHDVSIWFLPS